MIPIPIIPISQVAKRSRVLHLALWAMATLFIREMGLDFPRYGGYRFVIELSWINSLSPSHPLGVILSPHPSRFLLLSFPTAATLHCARYASCLMEIPANSAQFRKKNIFFPLISVSWFSLPCNGGTPELAQGKWQECTTERAGKGKLDREMCTFSVIIGGGGLLACILFWFCLVGLGWVG